ncbi:aminofutalosine deaminase family hydrolase [Campylobacter devanensis]|uniref:aminofutalosine deaminase family hydrolase n=1 Tax=Campylobacter devanensis TaxID=3161138 RepID=UPI000A33AC6B|nr:aminofutalosine deaminase family hydrolase [Campylobacter sp. P090]
MKILKAKFIILCNESFDVVQNGAIAFDKTIHKISKFDELIARFSDAEILDFSDDIAMPALINSHIHLEFSANKTTLEYGDFLRWLKSIIANGDTLANNDKNSAIKSAIATQLDAGVSTIGEISSYGIDALHCANSPIRTVYFSEILGSNPALIEQQWNGFLKRFNVANELKSDLFIPAISVHSPYSTHIELSKKALKLAKDNGMIVATHFMESIHEKIWLENSSGEFGEFFKGFNKNATPFYTPKSFIELFADIQTLFIHSIFADNYINLMDKNLHSIISCPVSNRLLSSKFNLQNALNNNINIAFATDGLSSNISLNIWDELRAGLMAHSDIELSKFATFALKSVTSNPAKALGLNLGELKAGNIADIAVFNGFELSDISQLCIELILHTKSAKALYIKGEKCNY